MSTQFKPLILALFICFSFAGFLAMPALSHAAACNFTNTNIRFDWAPSSQYDNTGSGSYAYTPGSDVARSYGDLGLSGGASRNWKATVNVTNNGVTKTLVAGEYDCRFINQSYNYCYTQTGNQEVGGAYINLFFEVQSYIRAYITCTPGSDPDLIGYVGGAVTTIVNQAVTLYGQVGNSGSSSAGSSNGMIEICDANCATIHEYRATSLASIAPAATRTVSGSYTPTALTQLYYRVCADWNGSVAESNESNNCSGWQTLTVSSAPVPPTAGLGANPLSVPYGSATTLTWGSTNATSCTGTNFSTGGATSGSVSASPTAATTYTVTCTSTVGSASDSETVTVTPAPQADLTAGGVSPSSATAGNSTSLSAVATNAGTAASGSFPVLFQVSQTGALVQSAYVAALAPGGTGNASGSYTFPSAGTYSVRACANYNTSWTAITAESNYDNNCGPWTTVTVAPAQNPALACSASATSIVPGQSVTYSANPSGGASGPYAWTAADGGSYGTGSTASRTFSTPGTYAMSVDTSSTAASNCPNVTVAANWCTASASDLTITATPSRVRSGQSSTLTWNATGVNGQNASCTVTGPGVSWSSAVSAPPVCSATGSANPTIQTQSTYTLTCAGVSESVTVNVIPNFQEF